MSLDVTKPIVGESISVWSSVIIANVTALAQALDPAVVSFTSLPTNAIGFSSANKRWEKYNGSSWVNNEPSGGYAINISGTAAVASSVAWSAVTGKPTLASGWLTDAITTSNIGSQSVNYANSAGSAGSAASAGSASTASTQAQFNNSTSIATTAFVQAVGFNFAGYSQLSGPASFSAAHIGKVVDLQTGGATYTLMAASAVPAGAALLIRGHATADSTIACFSGDTISNGITGLTSFTLKAALTVILVNVGGGFWLVVGGSAKLQWEMPTLFYGKTLMTAQATTSGTTKDFTGIPSWVQRITVMFNGVSTNGSSQVQLQLGAGSIETTGYVGQGSLAAAGGSGSFNSTTGLLISSNNAAGDARSGSAIFTYMGSNAWTMQAIVGVPGGSTGFGAGVKTLSGVLDRLRLTTVNGTDTFDAGSVNVMYE